jgi:hypothetical protein
MKILFVGDIVGRSGRDSLETRLDDLRGEFAPDFVIVNGENAAHGFGITEKICSHFYDLGVDCITTGNHALDQREVIGYIGREKRLIRPINYPPEYPGNTIWRGETQNGHKILVAQALGRVFVDEVDCPFRALDGVLDRHKLGNDYSAIIVDFHAETTAEKMALAHYLDGRVSAVLGTHTHVPTADARILGSGTAFQSDVGMTGDYDSVIGMRKDVPIQKMTRKYVQERMTPANGEATLCGSYIEIDGKSGSARHIQPIQRGGRLKQF